MPQESPGGPQGSGVGQLSARHVPSPLCSAPAPLMKEFGVPEEDLGFEAIGLVWGGYFVLGYPYNSLLTLPSGSFLTVLGYILGAGH